MSLIVAEYGAFQIVVKYLHQKNKGGVWYFRRRVPDDVRGHYPSLNKAGVLFVSLKTKNQLEAAKKANQMALEQDALWRNLRDGEVDASKDVDSAAIALLSSFGFVPYQGDKLETDNAHYDRFIDELHFQAEVQGGIIDPAWQEQLPIVHRRAAELLHSDLPPTGPSFITRVCGFDFGSRRFRAWQARRARSSQIAQASGALRPVFCSRAMSVA